MLHRLGSGLRVLVTLVCLLVTVSVAQAQATITINQKTQKFIKNVSELDREKYLVPHFRIDGNDPDITAFNQQYNLPVNRKSGRRFRSPIAKAFGTNQVPALSTLTNKYDGVRSVQKSHVATAHPFNVFTNKNYDYPAPGNNAAVTAYFKKLATYVARAYRDSEDNVPQFLEPMNEPFVKVPKLYPNESQAKTDIMADKVAECYKEIAKAIHAVNELRNMKVIGPSNAWPEFEINNFQNWNKRQKRFMDLAGADMDGFAIHPYDASGNAFGSGLNSSGGLRSGSNMEAILDMIENYSWQKWGLVKPIAVTEYGQLVQNAPGWKTGGDNTFFNYTPTINSQAVRSQIHMAIALMERGADISVAVPFSVDKNNNFDALYQRASLWIKKNGKFELTPRKFFFEVWKDIKGKRVDVASNTIDVQTQGFVSGNKLYVVLNNLRNQNITCNLNMPNKSGLQNVQIKRIKVPVGATASMTINTQNGAPNSLGIAYGETIVLTYTFNSAITFNNTLTTRKHYAGQTLRPIQANNELSYNINGVQKSGSGRAIVRVGVGRPFNVNQTTQQKSNKNLRPTVKINNQTVNYSGDVIRGYEQLSRKNFFGTLEIPIPYNLLQSGTNNVKVSFPDGGGQVSSVILQVSSFGNTTPPPPPPPTGNDVTATFRNVGSNNFMSAQNPAALSVKATAGATETFEIVNLDGGTIAGQVRIRASNGNFINSENGAQVMTANKNVSGEYTAFTLVAQSNGSYAIRGNNNQYVRNSMFCTSPDVTTWQQWNVNVTGGGNPPPPPTTYTLNTSANGPGSVSVSPAGGSYAAGTVVTLTASPNSGSRFDNWSGAASGTSTTTTVTMDGNKSVTANFSNNPPPPPPPPPSGDVTATFRNVGSNNFMSAQNPAAMSVKATAGATETFEIVNLDGGSIAGEVRIRASNGNFINSENGAQVMTANKNVSGTYTVFNLVLQSDGSYAIRGNNNQYVRNNMFCTSPDVTTWQQWNITITGGGSSGPNTDVVSFRNLGSNNYMTSQNASAMATKATRGATEKFTITYLANDQVTLQGSNGRYVSAENGTKAMTCNRLSPGVQETFTLVDQPNGSVALQGANGQYLRGNMLCTSPSVGTWQQWNLEGGLTKSLEAELSPLKVFPNPLRTGALVVNWGETELPQTVEVIDLKGALIYRATGLRGQAHKLPRTAFRGAGLYVLRVGDRTTTRFEKVVVH